MCIYQGCKMTNTEWKNGSFCWNRMANHKVEWQPGAELENMQRTSTRTWDGMERNPALDNKMTNFWCNHNQPRTTSVIAQSMSEREEGHVSEERNVWNRTLPCTPGPYLLDRPNHRLLRNGRERNMPDTCTYVYSY